MQNKNHRKKKKFLVPNVDGKILMTTTGDAINNSITK